MEKKRKNRRTKVDIENSINKAAISLIEEAGFSNLTIRKIAREADIEAVVFYNRYKDINEFIAAFVKKTDYWFSEIIKDSYDDDFCKGQYVRVLNELFDSLQSNKIMQELLKWEISTNNSITQHTAKLREYYTLPLVAKYQKEFENSSVKFDSVSALIVGGIYYLTLHSEMSTFCGIDINTKDGKQQISSTIEYLAEIIFTERSSDLRILEVAKKMKAKGIDIIIIAECTDLPIDIVQNL